MSFMYKSMGAKHSNWQLSQNNQYVSYALLSLGGRIKLYTLTIYWVKIIKTNGSFCNTNLTDD